MEAFSLEGRDYIELNKLLKLLQLVETGGEANSCIEHGEVLVNDVVELRKRHKVRGGFTVSFRGHIIEVKP